LKKQVAIPAFFGYWGHVIGSAIENCQSISFLIPQIPTGYFEKLFFKSNRSILQIQIRGADIFISAMMPIVVQTIQKVG